MIYCKNFCKCHSVPSVQQEYNKKLKKKKELYTYKKKNTYNVSIVTVGLDVDEIIRNSSNDRAILKDAQIYTQCCGII
jgi:hypothetical protein